MTIESLSNFTPQAATLWGHIPETGQKLLLAKVYCVKCCVAVPMINYSGAVKGGDLLLVGKCSVCHGDVARVVECN